MKWPDFVTWKTPCLSIAAKIQLAPLKGGAMKHTTGKRSGLSESLA